MKKERDEEIRSLKEKQRIIIKHCYRIIKIAVIIMVLLLISYILIFEGMLGNEPIRLIQGKDDQKYTLMEYAQNFEIIKEIEYMIPIDKKNMTPKQQHTQLINIMAIICMAVLFVIYAVLGLMVLFIEMIIEVFSIGED